MQQGTVNVTIRFIDMWCGMCAPPGLHFCRVIFPLNLEVVQVV